MRRQDHDNNVLPPNSPSAHNVDYIFWTAFDAFIMLFVSQIFQLTPKPMIVNYFAANQSTTKANDAIYIPPARTAGDKLIETFECLSWVQNDRRLMAG
ncbi:hypothetical protein BC2230_30075 [Burkholderia cepacia]